jgi:hypothetical protein
MEKKKKIMEALLGECNLTSLSSEDIIWAASHLPGEDSVGDFKSNLKFNHNANKVNEAIGLEDDFEMTFIENHYKNITDYSKVSKVVEAGIDKLSKEDIAFLFAQYTSNYVEKVSDYCTELDQIAVLLKKMRNQDED